jgi:hypothetical protein
VERVPAVEGAEEQLWRVREVPARDWVVTAVMTEAPDGVMGAKAGAQAKVTGENRAPVTAEARAKVRGAAPMERAE